MAESPEKRELFVFANQENACEALLDATPSGCTCKRSGWGGAEVDCTLSETFMGETYSVGAAVLIHPCGGEPDIELSINIDGHEITHEVTAGKPITMGVPGLHEPFTGSGIVVIGDLTGEDSEKVSFKFGVGVEVLGTVKDQFYFMKTPDMDFSDFCTGRTYDLFLIAGLLVAALLVCVGIQQCMKRNNNRGGGGGRAQGVQMQQPNPMQAQATTGMSTVPVAQAQPVGHY